ncbi:MAG: hypothetical protein IJ733_10730 [Lachnospiraceae bacterium]|nr:hypothetical protein [Lachnospiraceae bacterium]
MTNTILKNGGEVVSFDSNGKERIVNAGNVLQELKRLGVAEDSGSDKVCTVTGDGALVIYDLTAFLSLLPEGKVQEGPKYLSTTEYGKRHKMSAAMIKVHCQNGRLKGAYKLGSRWYIPENAPYPEDRRSGNGRRR